MKRDVSWNIAGTVIMVLATLIAVPLFLRFYGADRYGVLVTVWALLGYFSLFDFGMGPAVVRALSSAGSDDDRSTARVFWTALLMNFSVGMCVALLVFLLSLIFGPAAKTDLQREIVRATPWFALMVPISLVYPILIGALDARRLFRLANVNQALGSLWFQFLPLVLVFVTTADLQTAALGSLAGRTLSALILLWLCFAKLHVGRPQFDRGSVRSLTSFGGWMAVSSSASVLLDTVDRFVVSYFMGASAAAWYAIAYTTVSRVRSLPQAVTRALFPRVASDPVGSRESLFKCVRILSLILVPGICAAMVLADPLLRAWLGAEAAAQVTPLTYVMLLGIFMNCLAPIPMGALQAGGHPNKVAFIHLLQIPPFLAVMILATMHFGVLGAAVMWSARVTLDAALMFRAAGMQRSFLREGLAPALLPLSTFGLMVGVDAPMAEKTSIVAALVASWAVIDTLAARLTGQTVTVLTLGSGLWPRSRWA
jgi:O-antigen/teichoic acid export membrane protein